MGTLRKREAGRIRRSVALDGFIIGVLVGFFACFALVLYWT